MTLKKPEHPYTIDDLAEAMKDRDHWVALRNTVLSKIKVARGQLDSAEKEEADVQEKLEQFNKMIRLMASNLA